MKFNKIVFIASILFLFCLHRVEAAPPPPIDNSKCQDISGMYLDQRGDGLAFMQNSCTELNMFRILGSDPKYCRDILCNVWVRDMFMSPDPKVNGIDLDGFYRHDYWICGTHPTVTGSMDVRIRRLSSGDLELEAIKSCPNVRGGQPWTEIEVFKKTTYFDTSSNPLTFEKVGGVIEITFPGFSETYPVDRRMSSSVATYLDSLPDGTYTCDSNTYFSSGETHSYYDDSIVVPMITKCW